MSDVDVAAIREALAKATPGPWQWDADDVENADNGPSILRGTETVLSGPWTNDNSDCVSVSQADADLIVLLRNNAEALLNALQRAEASGLARGWGLGFAAGSSQEIVYSTESEEA